VDGAFVTGGSGFIGGRLIERLVRDGVRVRALARSDDSADKVRALGAEPVRGDLADGPSLERGARGCELVFHAAAELGDWGDPATFERVNVGGTRRVLVAAQRAGVRRVVHVGTEAALLAGEPLVAVDETAPLRPDSPALYSATKARAELEVLTAPHSIETVVRPRFVWGPGDGTLLPALVEQVRSGRFAWIGDGRHLTATTHVDNTVEGLVLAATRGADRGVWFVTDGDPIPFREMVERLLATQGIEVPDRSVPAPVARALAGAGERLWRTLPLPGRPPLTRFALWIASLETTIDDSRAERELGYAPVISRDRGLAELAAAPA
jgi:nucleoside-diphosphate-sugar epimerase